jgi:hypothetical protein
MIVHPLLVAMLLSHVTPYAAPVVAPHTPVIVIVDPPYKVTPPRLVKNLFNSVGDKVMLVKSMLRFNPFKPIILICS